ncbi:VWA domain-containing protein [Akkermansiaceae bacterium]|nr:VWA domain-containing protein [Akkermansiaceae bacterium]MDB4299861.1 VWA domain-containing protein [bacterium]MDB4669906.1 VWA domain-containing protein [Akkermansiaceae bacterium]MDB4728714.1 VWA domain-containing protein [Akkermansiaceae bacterium]
MNDDQFIDQALKEHARLEGKDDQAFLDQLEESLDQHPVKNEETIEKEERKRRPAFSAIAALFLVTGTAVGIFFITEKAKQRSGDDIAVHSSDGSEIAPPFPPQAESSEASSSDVVGKLREQYLEDKRSKTPSDDLAVEVPMENSEPPVAKKPQSPSSSMARVISSSVASPTSVPVPVPAPVDAIVPTESTRYIPEPGSTSPRPATQPLAKVSKKMGPQTRGVNHTAQPRFKDGRGRDGRIQDSSTFGRRFEEAPSGEKYGQLIETGFLSPLSAPLSTFSTDVDTASYTNIRRHVQNGQAINPNAVRIEEMINYFDYSYPQPEGAHPFTVQSEVASCPWNENHRLVKIGLQGKSVNQGERKAANLVFLIDVSGSMSNADKLPLLVQSFQLLLEELNEDDRVSLVVYAGRQAVLLDPTAIDKGGRAKVAQALRNLSAGGSTHGSAGITTAYELARKAFIEGGVNRVILATDGDFNVGVTSHSALLQLVKKQADGEISLTVLGFGQGNLNDALLENLTNKGDGNYFYLDSLREGQKVFQSGLTGTIQTIAKDVKIQVEFNPGKVAQYRLIGYANRRLRDEDFANDKIDAGDIGAGHRVTALYEVIPIGAEQPALPGGLKYQQEEKPVVPKVKIVDSPELLTVKLRYKQPDGQVSTELSQPLTDKNGKWQQASEDFRFASAVSLWGMLLRDSKHAGSGNSELVTTLALSGKGDDEKGERAEFIDLLRRGSTQR